MDSVPKINSNKPNGYIYVCVCVFIQVFQNINKSSMLSVSTFQMHTNYLKINII